MPKNLKSTKMIDYRPIEIDDQKYKKVQKDTKSSRLMLFVQPIFLSWNFLIRSRIGESDFVMIE